VLGLVIFLRQHPFEFLGLEFADAIVGRTVGGRITPAMIQDVAYIGYLVEQKAPEGPYFEVAIIPPHPMRQPPPRRRGSPTRFRRMHEAELLMQPVMEKRPPS
jgi:hypothetical protein